MAKKTDVLDEKPVRQALERLYRHRKFLESGLGGEILDTAVKLVAASRSEFTKASWLEIEAKLPMYCEFVEAREKREADWNANCVQCSHWRGEDMTLEMLLDIDEPQWCVKYKMIDITRPNACPSFDLDEAKCRTLKA